MKNKIFGGIAVLAIAVAAAWNVNLTLQNKDSSDVSLANAEALASGEGNGTHNCPGKYCSYRSDFVVCEACCPNGKTAVCNSFGCGCVS